VATYIALAMHRPWPWLHSAPGAARVCKSRTDNLTASAFGASARNKDRTVEIAPASPWPSMEPRRHSQHTVLLHPDVRRRALALVDPSCVSRWRSRNASCAPRPGRLELPSIPRAASGMQRERCGQLVRRFERLCMPPPAFIALHWTAGRSPLVEDRASHPVNPRLSSPRSRSNRDGRLGHSQRPRPLQPPHQSEPPAVRRLRSLRAVTHEWLPEHSSGRYWKHRVQAPETRCPSKLRSLECALKRRDAAMSDSCPLPKRPVTGSSVTR
jgi:hypothetical protein